MHIGDRVKEIRKNLKLSQTLFGEKLGVSRDVINNVENNRVELSSLLSKAICSEFNVNETWLKDGLGNAYNENEEQIIFELAKKYGLADLETETIQAFVQLPVNIRKRILVYIKSIVDHACIEAIQEQTNSEISDEIESYRHELEAAKKARTSSALPATEEGII